MSPRTLRRSSRKVRDSLVLCHFFAHDVLSSLRVRGEAFPQLMRLEGCFATIGLHPPFLLQTLYADEAFFFCLFIQSARTLPSAPPPSTTSTSALSEFTSRRARARPRRTASRSVRFPPSLIARKKKKERGIARQFAFFFLSYPPIRALPVGMISVC